VKKFLFLFVTILAFSFVSTSRGSDKLPKTTVFLSPKLQVEAEIASTDETRSKGLMFRDSMPDDAGMLFVFPEMDRQTFWMKNTLIPLDLIWLNERKEIVYFVTAPPCEEDPCVTYEPMQKTKYVLELNGGFLKKHNIPLGTRLEFSLPPEIERIVNRKIGF
jgi:uncharacterized protein